MKLGLSDINAGALALPIAFNVFHDPRLRSGTAIACDIAVVGAGAVPNVEFCPAQRPGTWVMDFTSKIIKDDSKMINDARKHWDS